MKHCINGIDQITVLAPNGKPSILFEGLLDAFQGDQDKAYKAYLKTQTRNFKNWFEGSQVIDSNGEPLVMYHKSKNQFDEFLDSKKGSNTINEDSKEGFFFSEYNDYDIRINEKGRFGDNIYPVFLNIKESSKYIYNPYFLMDSDFVRSEIDKGEIDGFITKQLNYDEMPVDNKIHTAVVFKPNQIKSIFNEGSFNRKTNNIYFNLDNPFPTQTPNWYEKVISNLKQIRYGESIKDKDASLKSERYLRDVELKNQIEELQQLGQQGVGNYFDSIKRISDQHKAWIFDNVIDSNKATIDSASYSHKLIQVWKHIDQIVYKPTNEEEINQPWSEQVKDIIKDYSEIQSRFNIVAQRVIVAQARKQGLPIDNDAFTNLRDINAIHFLTMELNRNPNTLVQFLGKTFGESQTKIDVAENRLVERAKYFSDLIKNDNLDVNRFFQKDQHKLLTLVNEEFYKDWRKVREVGKPTLNAVEDVIQLLDYDELFPRDSNGNVELNTSSVQIQQIKDKLGNGKEVDKFVETVLERQRIKIQKYFVDYLHQFEKSELTEDQAIDVSFSNEAKTKFNYWININSPFRIRENLAKGSLTNLKNYLIPIPSNVKFIDTEYLNLVKDDKYGVALQEFKDITKEILDGLPTRISNRLHESFVPIIKQSLIGENLSLKELVQSLKNKKTYLDLIREPFTASDNIKQNESLEDTLRFLEKPEEKDATDASRNLPALLVTLGKMALHYKYFNEVKPTILLMKDLIETSSNLALNYNGQPQYKSGDYLKEKAAKNLPNLIKMIEENLSQTVYLNRTTPEIPLPISFKKTQFNEIVDIINKEKNTGRITTDDADFEIDLLTKSEEKLNKNWIDKGKESFKIQKFEDTEKLLQYYLDKQQFTRDQYRIGQITQDAYKTEMQRWSKRIELINKNTIYGSKILDKLIQYKRLVTLGLSPFSGFNNLMSAIAGGGIYSAGGVDFGTKDYLKALGIMMSSWKGIQGSSDVQAKKLRNLAIKLQIDKELVDLQGLQSNTNFDKAAYFLMRKSENFGRMSLVVAYLLANKEGERSLWDSFDNDGNWIGEGEDYVEVEGQKRIELIRKLQRITGTVMGSTGVKILNKTIAGRLVGQFRVSWLPEVFASRFETESYDERLGRNVKGRYLTYKDLGFTNSIIGIVSVWQSYFGDAQNYKNLYTRNGNQISQTDIENLRKNAAEALLIASLMMAIAGLKYMADDDENKKLYSIILNQFFFLEKDLTSFSFGTINELIGGNLIPSYKLIQDFVRFTNTFYDYTFGDEEEGDKVLYKLGKIVPGLNVYSKFTLQTEKLLE